MSSSIPRNPALIVLSAVVCVPLLVLQWPPLFDYLMNLGRIYIIHDLLTAGRFADRYSLAPSIVPNLGMDAIVLPLMFLGFSISVAGRLFVALVIILSALAVVALHRALFARVSVLPLVAFAFAYNELLMTGFLTCQLSFALAILAFAAWLRWARTWPPIRAAAALIAAVTVLFFCHLMGALILLGLIAAHDLATRLAPHLAPRLTPRPLLHIWPALILAALAIVLLFSSSPFNAPDPAETGPSFLAELLRIKTWRLGLLPPILSGYGPRVDIPVAAILGLGLGLLAALLTRRLRIAWTMAPAIAGLVVLLVLVPSAFHDTWYIPDRLPFVILFLTLSSLDVDLPTPRLRHAVALAILALILARTTSAALAWSAIADLRRPVIAALGALPPTAIVCGSHQTVTPIGGQLRFPFSNLGALATIRSGAFSTSIFARREWNWLVPRPAWQARIDAAPNGSNRVDLAPQVPQERADLARPAALAMCDYMIVTRPTLYQRPFPPAFETFVSQPDITLFRIVR